MSIKIEVDEDLKDILPGFMENRRNDLQTLKELLSAGNLDQIEKIGHKVAGSSGGYGFHELGHIARKIEMAAKDKNIDMISGLITDYEANILDVEVVFISME